LATFKPPATMSARLVEPSEVVRTRPTATTARVINAGGSSRLARRRQNAGNEKCPVVTTSLRISVPINIPERVKNSETPRNPPLAWSMPRWNATTATTASPRRPSSPGWWVTPWGPVIRANVAVPSIASRE
jgi:hypothetical protein